MDILILTGLLLLGGLLNFIKEADVKLVTRIASVYLFIALLSAAGTWVFYFAGIKNSVLLKALGMLLLCLGYALHILLGNLLVYIALALRQSNHHLQYIIRFTLWAITVSIGNSFVTATVGKSMNMPYMLSFFKQSGYAVWFLYFIMTVESLGALGILLHFKLKTGPLAATGLILIMLGAVYTHWHNKDPFSDSYAAVGQLINLSLLLTLYYFEKQANRKLLTTTIYIV